MLWGTTTAGIISLPDKYYFGPEVGGVEPHTPRSVPFAYQTKIHPVDFTLPATSGKTIIS